MPKKKNTTAGQDTSPPQMAVDDRPSETVLTNYGLSTAIANGGSTSAAEDLGGFTLVGLLMPAAFTGTAVTFQMSDSLTGTYRTVYSAGADYSVTVAASKYVALDPTVMAGCRFVKIVSNGTEGGARTIILAARPV